MMDDRLYAPLAYVLPDNRIVNMTAIPARTIEEIVAQAEGSGAIMAIVRAHDAYQVITLHGGSVLRELPTRAEALAYAQFIAEAADGGEGEDRL